MKRKSQVLYWDIKACIEKEPMTVRQIADKLGFDYHRIFDELIDLEKLGKVVKVVHDDKTMVLWTDVVLKFEYELKHNIIEMRKVNCQFIGTPSEKFQVKLPQFVYKALKEKIKITTKFDLMLEVKAIFVDNRWYRIKEQKVE